MKKDIANKKKEINFFFFYNYNPIIKIYINSIVGYILLKIEIKVLIFIIK